MEGWRSDDSWTVGSHPALCVHVQEDRAVVGWLVLFAVNTYLQGRWSFRVEAGCWLAM